jgi:hypothetical protein
MGFGDWSGPPINKPMRRINVTPLVDVMLVLLVIFIITAPLMASRLALNSALRWHPRRWCRSQRRHGVHRPGPRFGQAFSDEAVDYAVAALA